MDRPDTTALSGLLFALLSAMAFATSGSFGKSLLETGWSPGAAVTARIGIAGLVLLVPAVVGLRGRGPALRAAAPRILVYGMLAVAGCQLFYFNAVQTLSVGVALLLEFLGPVLVVGWLWLRNRRPPGTWTIIGVILSLTGLVLVLDAFGDLDVDPVGVGWGLAAAVGLAAFFIISADADHGVPAIAMAGLGMLIGAATLLLAGLLGAMPLDWATDPVVLRGREFPWWVPVAGLAIIAGALSYATGIVGARRLGSRIAAFVGLTEVLFAVLFAWLLLDELPMPIQLAGGALILAGVAAVRQDSDEEIAESAPNPEPLPGGPPLGAEPHEIPTPSGDQP